MTQLLEVAYLVLKNPCEFLMSCKCHHWFTPLIQHQLHIQSKGTSPAAKFLLP